MMRTLHWSSKSTALPQSDSWTWVSFIIELDLSMNFPSEFGLEKRAKYFDHPIVDIESYIACQIYPT